MALPLLLGLGGSALAGSLGANALLYGAVGSGLGSLAQGDDFETAVGTGLMSYFGGKALGGMFGGGADKLANVSQQPLMASAAPTSSLAQNMITPAQGAISANTAMAAQQAAAPAAASGSGFSNFFKSPAGATIKGSGLEGIKQAATNPYALSAVGTTGLLESMKPQGVDMPSDDYDIPEAEAATRKRNPILPGYRPGFDPEMPYFRYAEGGEVQKPNDKEIINNAVNAIKGVDPEPERSLAIFVSTYGEEALKDLVGRVRSGEFDDNAQTTEGMVEGIGDGMDDMIPATLEGEQDVVLSDGEFIVPADVVSGLGNGSTDAGSKSLYDMMDRVREMRTGMKDQPDQVPQGMMLPA
jgi:hypothetical protein